MKKLPLLFFLSLVITGCQTLQDITESIQIPKLSVDDVRVTGFNFQEMHLTYDIKVANPNAASIQMLGYDYGLSINGDSFLTGDQTEKITVEASDESIFQVPMTINFSDLYDVVSGVATKDEASYRFLSHLNFDIPILGETEIPVEKQGKLPMVKLPKLNVQDLTIDNISLSSADVNLKLRLDNPNGFGLNIDQLNYDLIINGSQWAVGKALQDVNIKEKGITELSIPISLNIGQIGRSAYQILSGSESVAYKLKGNFQFNALHKLLGTTDFDFNRTGKISINR